MGIQTQQDDSRLAIVGMDAFWGGCRNLNEFDRSIYDATQHFTPVPDQRWGDKAQQEALCQRYGWAESHWPQGAYINPQDLILPIGSFATTPGLEPLPLQDQLMFQVAARALQDGGVVRGASMAVVVTTASQLSLQQLRQQLHQQLHQQIAQPRSPQSDSSSLVPDTTAIAQQIADHWQLTGPALTLTAESNSIFKVLEIARHLLMEKEVEGVLVGAVDLAGDGERISLQQQLTPLNTGTPTLSYDRKANGWMIGEGAGAIVLQRYETAHQSQQRIYAVIDAIGLVEPAEIASEEPGPCHPPTPEMVMQACDQAFELAGVQPNDIQYLEVFGSGLPQQDAAEMTGLAQVYQSQTTTRTCAIGSVKTIIGHTWGAAGLDGLIKTALCLYHRYLPATPAWSGPKSSPDQGQDLWQNTLFYVPSESRPWIVNTGKTRRMASLSGFGQEGSYAHVILSEDMAQLHRQSHYLAQTPFYLLAIAGNTTTEIQEQLRHLQTRLESRDSLGQIALETFRHFQQQAQVSYALAILGRNREEILREIEWAFDGVAQAMTQAGEWQTPAGSYFTAKPLGQRGKLAYVYPGAYNAYVGLARRIFRLFPNVWESPLIQSFFEHAVMVEKLLYPKSLRALSPRQMEAIERQLLDSPLDLLEAEVGFACLITTILQNDFRLRPNAVLGYSLGEISMMHAQGVWSQGISKMDEFRASSLFKTRLSGPKLAVQEFWQMPATASASPADFWQSYILLANAAEVQALLHQNHQVFLTQINTPDEVVIAGEPQACAQLIQHLGCNAVRSPLNHAIHCPAMASEYPALVNLNTLTSQAPPDPPSFYSTATYAPIPLERQAIAHSIAQNLCQQLDFPRLIQRVYADGVRIFVEAGVGSNCCRWIDAILPDQEHLTVYLNRRGMDEHTVIVKALAKLLSHRVPLDLSPLYGDGTNPLSTIHPQNQPVQRLSQSAATQQMVLPDPVTSSSTSGLDMSSLPLVTHQAPDRKPFQDTQFTTLCSQMTKMNLNLLQARRASRQQISQLIQLQFELSQQLLEQAGVEEAAPLD